MSMGREGRGCEESLPKHSRVQWEGLDIEVVLEEEHPRLMCSTCGGSVFVILELKNIVAIF